MRYSVLKNLLKRYLLAADTELETGSEILDCLYVRDQIQAIIGSHQDTDELEQKQLAAVSAVLASRFEYIRHFPLIYSEYTVSPVNQFCEQLARELQGATGVNHLLFLMPSLKPNAASASFSQDDDQLAVTDFILSSGQRYVIDVAACLRAAEADAKLRHTQHQSHRHAGEGALLSSNTKERLLQHSAEARAYYSAIVARHNFNIHGTNLAELLQELADGLQQASTVDVAHTAIARFAAFYATLSAENKAGLDNLAAAKETFASVWQALTVLDTTKTQYAATACDNLQKIINRHRKVLSEVTIHPITTQFGGVTPYDQAMEHARLRFTQKRWQLRQKLAHFAPTFSAEQDQALTQILLNKVGKHLLMNLSKELREVLQIKAITVGANHTFILMRTGELYACGANHYGQLGLGDNKDHFNPTKVAKLPDKVSQTAASQFHSFIVTEGGEMYSFGNNNYEMGLGEAVERGVLGLGDEMSRNMPTKVPGINDKVVQVAAGLSHAIALTAAGDVYAFGNNSHGQLGLGDTTQRLKPAKLANLDGKVIEIASGNAHILLLTDKGSVYTCGLNIDGQLGLGDLQDRLTPTKVPGIRDKIVQIAAGHDHSVFRSESGDVYSFGLNQHGQLGLGDKVNRNVPTKIIGMPDKITYLAASDLNTLIFTDNNELFASGSNFLDTMGLAEKKDYLTPEKVTEFVDGVNQIATGCAYTLVLTKAGKLYACGFNNCGQLGLGHDYARYQPTLLPEFERRESLLRALDAYFKAQNTLSAAPAALLFAGKPPAVSKTMRCEDNPDADSNHRWRTARK